MGNLFRDLWASLQIFYSNFNASYGHLVNFLVIAAIVLVTVYAFLRAVLARRKGGRCPSPLGTMETEPKRTERAVRSLCEAIAIPSVTGDREALKRLTDWLKTRYPGVMRVMDCAETPNGSLLLRWRARETGGEAPAAVLLCAHLDVVPAGGGWSVCEAFDGARIDGKVYGRGAVDCKGVLISMLEAAESLIQEDYAPKHDLYFAFGSDEETGGQEGAKNIARTLQREGIRFDLILDEGGGLSETVCDGEHFCAALLGLGEKRQCTYEITVDCPGGHTCQPNRSTALGVLSEAICRIETAQPHHHLTPLVREYLDRNLPTFTFGKRFAVANKPLFRLMVSRVFREDPEVMAMIRTTVVPVSVEGHAPAANVLQTTANVHLNARLLPVDTPEKILKELQSLLADLPLTVEPGVYGEESFITSEKTPMYRLLCEVLQEQIPHLPCIPTLMTCTSDARHYSALSDCVIRFAPLVTGPDAGGNSHMGNEFVDERSVGIAVSVYRALMKKL